MVLFSGSTNWTPKVYAPSPILIVNEWFEFIWKGFRFGEFLLVFSVISEGNHHLLLYSLPPPDVTIIFSLTPNPLGKWWRNMWTAHKKKKSLLSNCSVFIFCTTIGKTGKAVFQPCWLSLTHSVTENFRGYPRLLLIEVNTLNLGFKDNVIGETYYWILL